MLQLLRQAGNLCEGVTSRGTQNFLRLLGCYPSSPARSSSRRLRRRRLPPIITGSPLLPVSPWPSLPPGALHKPRLPQLPLKICDATRAPPLPSASPCCWPRADRIAGTLHVGHHLYQGEVVSISAGFQILCSAAAVWLACTCEQPAGAQIRRLRSLQLN